MIRTIRLAVIIFAVALLASACQSFAPATKETPAPAAPPVNQPAPAPAPTTTSPTSPAPTPPSTQPALPPATTTPILSAPIIPEGNSIGNRAIDFQLETLDGQTVSLSGLRGKPVLINFWATWCVPCKTEMPYLQKVHDTWSEKGLVILEIDIKEKPETVKKFMTDLNLTMTVPMDTDGSVTKAYGITAIPTTFLIDKDGVIRQKVIGAFPNVAAIEKELGKIIP